MVNTGRKAKDDVIMPQMNSPKPISNTNPSPVRLFVAYSDTLKNSSLGSCFGILPMIV